MNISKRKLNGLARETNSIPFAGLMINSMQHSMIWVGTGAMPEGSTPEKTNRLASYSGAMAQSNMDQPNIGPGDRQTAVALGKRVAEAAVRWTPS